MGYFFFTQQLHSIYALAHPPNVIILFATNLITSLNNCDWQETPSSKGPGNSTDRQCLKGTDIAIRLPAGLKDNSKVISLDNVYYLILGLIRAHMWETHHLKWPMLGLVLGLGSRLFSVCKKQVIRNQTVENGLGMSLVALLTEESITGYENVTSSYIYPPQGVNQASWMPQSHTLTCRQWPNQFSSLNWPNEHQGLAN